MSGMELCNGWKKECLLGEGSFGRVYKIAKEEFGHRYVAAIKEILVPSEDMAREIIEEYATMSDVKGHSNIVSCEDYFVTKDEESEMFKICIRMELLTPFVEYVKHNFFGSEDVVKLAIDMCKALEICEKKYILHGDIKPENIYISELGTYKLGDFGISKRLECDVSNGIMNGTYTYMAPEIYKGENYDHTADIYSLGIVLYKLLNNNRAPFVSINGVQDDEVREKANELRFSGSVLQPPCNASASLAKIVLKACDYEKNNRYQTAKEMRKDLEKILADTQFQDAINLIGINTDSEKTALLDENVISKKIANSDKSDATKKRKKKVSYTIVSTILILICSIVLFIYANSNEKERLTFTASDDDVSSIYSDNTKENKTGIENKNDDWQEENQTTKQKVSCVFEIPLSEEKTDKHENNITEHTTKESSEQEKKHNSKQKINKEKMKM